MNWRPYLPDVCVIVTRAAGQELVVWADGGFDIKRRVLVAAEDRHCGGKTNSNIQTKVVIERANREIQTCNICLQEMQPEKHKHKDPGICFMLQGFQSASRWLPGPAS